MHKSNVKSGNLLLSRKAAEMPWKEQRFKPQCLHCYLQIDKNSFHVLGSQYQPQWVHIVLQEINGKGIEILERGEQGFFLCKEGILGCFTGCIRLGREKLGFNEFKHLQKQINDNKLSRPGCAGDPSRNQELLWVHLPLCPTALPGTGRCKTPTHGWAQGCQGGVCTPPC